MDRQFDVPVDPEQSLGDVRIRSIDVEPYPDGRRLKCTLETTDFVLSPDVEIVIEDHDGHKVASSTNEQHCDVYTASPWSFSSQEFHSQGFVDIS